jgi:glycosyltransferase involved in cell wall biosynthesis
MMKNSKDLKVAIVHDWAYKMTGGEKCLEVFCELYPEADVYMMMGDSSKLSQTITRHKITYSFLQKIPFVSKFHRYTYFLWPTAIESFNFNKYDLVISSSACAAKGIVTGLDTLHVSYMHTPMRYAWDMTWYYFNPANFSWWKRLVIPFFLTYLRIWDIASSNRMDKLIANSNFVNRRIKKYYRRSADAIIFPPVYTSIFDYTKEREDYYLSVAPFEPNKRGDLVIEVAKRMGLKLKILGKGSKLKELQKRAEGYDNIEFLGFVSEDEKIQLLAKAKGLFFVGIEDFGIVPVEAIASGTPVIAFGKASGIDFVLEGQTGVFFYDQTVDAIMDAVERLDGLLKERKFDKKFMNNFAKKFSKERFVTELKSFIDRSLDEYFGK